MLAEGKMKGSSVKRFVLLLAVLFGIFLASAREGPVADAQEPATATIVWNATFPKGTAKKGEVYCKGTVNLPNDWKLADKAVEINIWQDGALLYTGSIPFGVAKEANVFEGSVIIPVTGKPCNVTAQTKVQYKKETPVTIRTAVGKATPGTGAPAPD